MVDELELLKKDWKKQDISLPKFSKEDIYPMLLKKSSSIVKWILIISIIEFVFWIALSIILDQRDINVKFMQDTGVTTINYILILINYGAIIYFIIRFYLNYKTIQSTDSSSKLMKNILKARRTVKQYIWFNIVFLFIGTVTVFGIAYYNSPETFDIDNVAILIVALIMAIIVVAGVLLLIYKVLYGRLLKRLSSNYTELKKLEI